MDYNRIGFKCGLEVHVQLNTGKLFCSCPSELRGDEPDFIIKRNLTSIAGELGDLDVAAELEKLKSKTFLYECFNYNDCLVEIDEEPPHNLNETALKVGLQVALLLHMTPLERVIVMRKTVIDGSNPSGFQRTALIAEDGYIKTSRGAVRINMLTLEEDAGRKMDESSKTITYRLDRLGIPLIELRTEPDMKDADHVKETAGKIGMITRMTGMVIRGIGTVRQDVNVSVKNGCRVEIKGCQDLRNLDKIVELETLRQMKLLEIKKVLRKKCRRNDLSFKIVNLSNLFLDSSSKLFSCRSVFGLKLKTFKGLMGVNILPNKRLGFEFSQYAKLYSGVAGIVHSDELPAYNLDSSIINIIFKNLKCSVNDGFVLVVAEKERAELALKAVFDRAVKCFDGVIGEVRNALEDNSTVFLRPIPGSARMYPETDLSPLVINDSFIRSVKRTLPSSPEQVLLNLKKLGLSGELASQIIHSRWLSLFESFVQEFGNPTIIASALLYGKDGMSGEQYKQLFCAVKDGLIGRDIINDLIDFVIKGGSISAFVEKTGSSLLSDKEVTALVKRVIAGNKDKDFNVIMGLLMKDLRGRVDGSKLASIVKKYL